MIRMMLGCRSSLPAQMSTSPQSQHRLPNPKTRIPGVSSSTSVNLILVSRQVRASHFMSMLMLDAVAAQMSPGARSVDTLPSYYSPRDSSRPTLSLPPPPPGLPCATHRSHTLAKSRPQPFVTLPPAPLSPRSLRHPSIGPDWRAQRKTYILPSQAMSVGKEHSLADSTESLTSNLTYHRFPLPPTHRDYRAGAYVNKPRPEFVTGAF